MRKQSRFDKTSRLPAAIRRALMLRSRTCWCFSKPDHTALTSGKTDDHDYRYRSRATYPLALFRLCGGRAWRHDGRDREPRSLVPQFRPRHLRRAMDGIDLFMGFVIGPILRKVGLSVRREIIVRLVPRTLFLMPTLSIITGTTGWFLAKDLGLLDVPWPQFGWVAAALALVVLMTIQGTGYLLPTNLWVCVQLRRPDPDVAKINRVMGNFFFVVGAQGLMQVLTIVIMARFVTGL